MTPSATMDANIGQMLLAVVLGLACLVALLAVRRAILGKLRSRSSSSVFSAEPPVRLFPPFPFLSGDGPFMSEDGQAEQGRPAPEVAGVAASWPMLVPTKPALELVAREARPAVLDGADGGLPPTRQRPRPLPLPLHLRDADETVLSPQSLLARAQELLNAGNAEEAAKQLRLCVRLASKLRQVDVEANARLELGDIAQASGDPTTACEHWQMARALFTQAQRVVDARASETRMERAGCPTDWVLTQF